jgi:hypothetical protein
MEPDGEQRVPWDKSGRRAATTGRFPVRTLRTTTISILALGLLAGSAVGVTAQEADPMAASTFTMQLVGEPDISRDAATGTTIVVSEWESSDPRASGARTEVVGGSLVPDDFARGQIQRNAVRIVNEGGSWVGSHRGFLTFPSDGPRTVQFLSELVGEGGYEGLSLFFATTGNTEDVREIGVIWPTVEVPAIPDLPAE